MIRNLIQCLPKHTSYASNVGIRVRYFSAALDEASATVNRLKDDPGNERKLKLYALYKQAKFGPCNVPKPGALDFVGKYKWEAWNRLGSMTKEDAEKNYVDLVKKLVAEIGVNEETGGASSGATAEAASSSGSGDDHIIFQKKDGVLTMKLNRPKVMNSITMDMYKEMTRQLNDAGKDPAVNLIVLTGTGDYYSSGNDLKTFATIKPDSDLKAMADNGKQILVDFVGAFIECPKPIIAAVNGHAFGIMVTTLALCDVVVCTDTATFITPFSATAQSPEGCSTLLFPKIFGFSKANEILMFNYKLSAAEALKYGFVSKVIPKDNFEKEVDEMIYGKGGILKTCNVNSIIAAKSLVRTADVKRELHQCNKLETEKLSERWLSPDFAKFIMSFMTRKK